MASTSFAEQMFREAFHLNSSAALEAMAGNGAEASSLFKHALKIISFIDIGPNTGLNCGNRLARSVSTIPLAFSKDESFCIYDRLLIFERPQGVGPAEAFDLTFYSAAIIFNMGLVFHQQGSIFGSRKFYAAAYRMYEKALNIIDNVPIFGDSDLDALHLAALNNRAHICLQMGTVRNTESDLENIRLLSSALLYSESFRPHLEETMISEILINSMVSGPVCAACA